MQHIKAIIARLRLEVIRIFNLQKLYFTAPTFITREVGSEVWEPKTMHDEYWHPHVDANNTAHYDYSALVYLSTSSEDFGVEILTFMMRRRVRLIAHLSSMTRTWPIVVTGEPSHTVAPRVGRMITFGSGRENPHRVERVTKGTRYVLSFWFTCDESFKFSNFLDGKQHNAFERVKEKRRKRKEGKGRRRRPRRTTL